MDSLQWRHNECCGVSNHQLIGCLLSSLFRRRSKKTWKLRVTGLCEGNPPVTGEFPAQRASHAENVSIWWRHDVVTPSDVRDIKQHLFMMATSHYLKDCLLIGGALWYSQWAIPRRVLQHEFCIMKLWFSNHFPISQGPLLLTWINFNPSMDK